MYISVTLVNEPNANICFYRYKYSCEVRISHWVTLTGLGFRYVLFYVSLVELSGVPREGGGGHVTLAAVCPQMKFCGS